MKVLAKSQWLEAFSGSETILYATMMADTSHYKKLKKVNAQSCKVRSLQPNGLLNSPVQVTLGSSVHGIFQARVLEWVAISFSGRAS